MKTPKKSTTLYCFSPPIMVITFTIEIIGAIYTFLRYKTTPTTRLIIAILAGLAIFQLAEFLICETPTLPGLTWARIGFTSITLLPPLGISLAISIAGKKSKLAQILLYATALTFITYYLFITGALTSETCAGNYVIFQTSHSSLLYALYYYGLLIIGIACCSLWIHKTKDKKISSALSWLALGYLAFLIPTTTVNIIDPSTISAIPSIMCGFAVALALILILAVLPKVAKPKN